MSNWKVKLELNGSTVEITIKAKSFPDAYVSAQVAYPGCRLISIKEIDDEPKGPDIDPQGG